MPIFAATPPATLPSALAVSIGCMIGCTMSCPNCIALGRKFLAAFVSTSAADIDG